MNAEDFLKALPQIATALGAFASLLGSIVAAIKASRAERASQNAVSIGSEIKAMVQAQSQRQVQELNINLATRGDAKGGELIDLSGGPPAAPKD
jgi:hypothetical protein